MASERRTHRISEVAAASGVSVRTLHYYDEIGLLVPRRRTRAGYRLYDDDDVLRLQQILIGRELGLDLDAIRRSLDDPSFDRKRTLLAQRRELLERMQRTESMIGAIDAALALLEPHTEETRVNTKELFDGFDPKRHETEAEQRWGNTEAYRESMRRTRSYTPEDWKRYAEEQSAIYRDAAALLRSGTPASAAAAMDVAERHRSLIDRWFYPCSHATELGLADMYEADPRFAANIDKFGAGLTPFLAAAIRANARRHGA